MLANIPQLPSSYFAPTDRTPIDEDVDRDSSAYKQRNAFIFHCLKILFDDFEAAGTPADDGVYMRAKELESYMLESDGEPEDFLYDASALVFEKYVYENGFDMQQYDVFYAIIDRAQNENFSGGNGLYNFSQTLKGFEFTAAVFAIVSFMIDTCNMSIDAADRGLLVADTPHMLQ
jgi:hypothetical protein